MSTKKSTVDRAIITTGKTLTATESGSGTDRTTLILRALRLGWTPAAIAQLYGSQAGERALAIMAAMIAE